MTMIRIRSSHHIKALIFNCDAEEISHPALSPSKHRDIVLRGGDLFRTGFVTPMTMEGV